MNNDLDAAVPRLSSEKAAPQPQPVSAQRPRENE
jgi:hypothetical protein